jgi:hypothetical protein
MAKKKPRPAPAAPAIGATDVPVVGPREPCPCGSGKRYKLCHGRAAARAERRLVARPFEGLAGECDLIAMREMVPAATAALTLTGEAASQSGGRQVLAATVLPGMVPGWVRATGDVLVGMQTGTTSGDPSRDLADVLLRALEEPAGAQVTTTTLPGPGPRLQDILDPDAPFEVQMHEGFDFWTEGTELTAELRAVLDRANSALVPTVRLPGLTAAYWVRIGDKEHLRWVLPYEEDRALDAFARLHAAGGDTLGPQTRFIGSFRACGLLVPVWDLAPGTEAEQVGAPAAAYLDRLQEALATSAPLTPPERQARAGLVNRQLTLR